MTCRVGVVRPCKLPEVYRNNLDLLLQNGTNFFHLVLAPSLPLNRKLIASLTELGVVGVVSTAEMTGFFVLSKLPSTSMYITIFVDLNTILR